jgi:DNA-directed RNA polymerase specialized sigma24 family protein
MAIDWQEPALVDGINGWGGESSRQGPQTGRSYVAYESEQELITLARSGDERAFSDLWGRYQEAVKGYLAARVDDGLEVEALVNDVALTVWKKIRSYSERWKFYTFARYWAGIILLRYSRRQGRWMSRHLLLGDIAKVPPQTRFACATGLEDLAGQEDQGEAISWQEHANLLKITLTDGGKPHHTICFAYCKLIEGWGPQRIVRDLSDMKLSEIEQRLEQDYLRESGLPATVVTTCFSPLRMAVSGQAGMTCLRNYYGANPEGNVSDWAYKVRNKTLRAIEREKAALGANVGRDEDEQAS